MPNVVDARDLLHCPGGVQSMTHHGSFTNDVENRGAPVLMLPWTTRVAVLVVFSSDDGAIASPHSSMSHVV